MRRVLLLHTGGTLGMGGGRGRPLRPVAFRGLLDRHAPELRRIARLDVEIVANVDSSDIRPNLWQALARRIHRALGTARSRYHGVVVTHGTDTLAYTASALSFMLRGLDRPVVLTGSQRPLGEVRSDARPNLVDAVTVASSDLAEVAVCFHARLFRGNRVRKVKTSEYDAFDSPNHPPLGTLGVAVDLTGGRRRRGRGRRRLLPDLEPRVAFVKIFPGFAPELAQAALDAGARGVVLEAFGAGNFPLGEGSLLPFLRSARERGVPVVIASQAERNGVDLSLYQSGARALREGAIGAGDMTAEATVVKLMHALAYGRTVAGVRRILEADLAGERTPAVRAPA